MLPTFFTQFATSYSVSTQAIVIISLLVVWELIWKGVGLWKAGRNNQPGWFVAMLVLNTLGLLEIIYIIFFQTKENKTKS